MTLTPAQWFSRCAGVVLQREGWGAYTNTLGDPGGPTKFGITLSTLSAWRGQLCVAADVQALEEPEALDIFRANFWHPVAGDQLPAGINLMTFDCAVNQGPGHAARWLQGAADVPEDGVIGPATLLAVRSAEPLSLLAAFKSERLLSYEQDAGWADFGHGWENRDDQIAALAAQWASEPE